ncbi:MAG TPA: hypothetical protein VH418_09115 [Solirubrobacteraceae bacterium]|jgi:hypothetical protein
MPARGLLIALVLLALCAPPAAARIHPFPIIGIGDQQPDMFGSKPWRQLAVHDARYIAPWDVMYDRYQLFLMDNWLRAAGRAHVRVVIGFMHSVRSEQLARRLPTWRQYQRAFRRFRKVYPFLRNIIPWNEANSPGALTERHPHRAAQYFDVVARNCRTCAVTAADVLDTKTMVGWIKKFRRSVHVRPRIWGLHNYSGANHLSTRGTRRLLANTRGTIWFTETGGVVTRRAYHGRHFGKRYRYGIHHAAASTRFALRLSCLSWRVSRIYLYEWQPPFGPTGWDSGLLNPIGKPRPAFYAVRRWRRVSLRMSPRRARAELCRGFR